MKTVQKQSILLLALALAGSLPGAVTHAAVTQAAASASAVPGAQPAPARMPTRIVLDNGVTVVVQENHANPTVALSGALLTAGGVFDPPDRPGLASFTASQLERGTEKRSFLEIAGTLENIGASVSIGGGKEYVSLGGRALSRDFDTLLNVLSDELRHPGFPPEELERARSQALAGIQHARQSTRTLADIAFSQAVFPRGHPYYTPSLDDQAGIIKGMTRNDLVSFYTAHYAPDRLILTVVGDVTPDAAVTAVRKYFGDWTKKGNLPPISIPETPLPAGPQKAIVIPMPDKAQVDVIYGFPGQVKRTDPDFYRVAVLDTLLGGGTGLSSRLGVNVRDRLGLVYGIYASTAATLGAGAFRVGFGSNPANVDAAAAEMERQVTRLREEGATRQEVSEAIDYITGSYPVTLSTNGAVAGQLLIAEVYGLGLDYIQKRNEYYRAVTLEQVNAAAKKYLPAGVGAIAIAGTYRGKYSPGSKQ